MLLLFQSRKLAVGEHSELNSLHILWDSSSLPPTQFLISLW